MVEEGVYREERERKRRGWEDNKANVRNDLNVTFVDLKLFRIKSFGENLIQETQAEISIRIVSILLRPFDSLLPPLGICLEELKVVQKHLAKKRLAIDTTLIHLQCHLVNKC